MGAEPIENEFGPFIPIDEVPNAGPEAGLSMQFDPKVENGPEFPNTELFGFPPNGTFPKVGALFPGANWFGTLPKVGGTFVDAEDPKLGAEFRVCELKAPFPFPAGVNDPNALFAAGGCPNVELRNEFSLDIPNGADVSFFELFPNAWKPLSLFSLNALLVRLFGAFAFDIKAPKLAFGAVATFSVLLPNVNDGFFGRFCFLTGVSIAAGAENTNASGCFVALEPNTVPHDGVPLLFELPNVLLPLAESLEKDVVGNPELKVVFVLPTESFEKDVTLGKLEPNVNAGLVELGVVSEDFECKLGSAVGSKDPNVNEAFFSSTGGCSLTVFFDGIDSLKDSNGRLHFLLLGIAF